MSSKIKYSIGPPRVTVERTWVSHLQNSPVPWVRSNNPTSQYNGRISFWSLSSTLLCWERVLPRIWYLVTLKKAILIFDSVCSSSSSSSICSLKCSTHSFSYWANCSLKGTFVFPIIHSSFSSPKKFLTSSSNSWDGLLNITSFSVTFSSFKNSNWKSQDLLISSCQISKAFFKISKGISLDSSSIMLIESLFQATSKFNSAFSSSSRVGFTIKFQSR